MSAPITGLLVWIQSCGRQHPQIYWSHDGKRPEIDEPTKRLMVANHELHADLGEWTLAEAVARFPAPTMKVEA